MENEELKKIMERIGAGREYRRTADFEVREKQNGEEDRKSVQGYACTFGEEYLLYDWGDYRVLEQIDPHAFDECDMSDVIMQYDHQGRVFARVSNGTLNVRTDGHGLAVEAELGGTQIGQQLYEEIRGGYTTKMSFGFRVKEDQRIVTEDYEAAVTTVHRTITKISKLYDVSAVSLPANDGTEISARSWAEGVIAELKAERLRAEEEQARKVRAEEERAQKVRAMKMRLELDTHEN